MNESWLLLETSGRTGQIGLVNNNALTTASLDPQRRHARDLTSTAKSLLQQASIHPRDLTGVMVSVGPGSFTGLRVGIMSAKALSYATGAKLIAVPTFEIVAEQAPVEAKHQLIVADALKGMIYVQRFTRTEQGWKAQGDLKIAPAEEWLPWVSGETWLSGPGLVAHATRIPCHARLVPESAREPGLAALHEVGRRLTPLTREQLFALEPLYLRGSSAEEKALAQKAGEA